MQDNFESCGIRSALIFACRAGSTAERKRGLCVLIGGIVARQQMSGRLVGGLPVELGGGGGCLLVVKRELWGTERRDCR